MSKSSRRSTNSSDSDTLKQVNAPIKESDEDIARKLALMSDMNIDDTIDKEEQARAVSIARLTKTDPELIKILTDVSKQREVPHLLKIAIIGDLLEKETGSPSVLKDYPYEYLKMSIADKRKGRTEIVDIAKQKAEEFQNKVSAFKQYIQGGRI